MSEGEQWILWVHQFTQAVQAASPAPLSQHGSEPVIGLKQKNLGAPVEILGTNAETDFWSSLIRPHLRSLL